MLQGKSLIAGEALEELGVGLDEVCFWLGDGRRSICKVTSHTVASLNGGIPDSLEIGANFGMNLSRGSIARLGDGIV